MVQIPHYPKGTDVANLARARWGRAIDMNKDVVVFKDMSTKTQFRSKNFTKVDLPPGISAYHFIGMPTPPMPKSCMPLVGAKAPNDTTLVVQLDLIVLPAAITVRALATGVTTHGNAPGSRIVVTDAVGTVLEPTGDSPWLAPTSTSLTSATSRGFTHALGRIESSERPMQLLDYTPNYFVGKDMYQRFDGFGARDY